LGFVAPGLDFVALDLDFVTPDREALASRVTGVNRLLV
jgi:hypothetical protein